MSDIQASNDKLKALFLEGMGFTATPDELYLCVDGHVRIFVYTARATEGLRVQVEPYHAYGQALRTVTYKVANEADVAGAIKKVKKRLAHLEVAIAEAKETRDRAERSRAAELSKEAGILKSIEGVAPSASIDMVGDYISSLTLRGDDAKLVIEYLQGL